MKLFIDSAIIEEINHAWQLGIIDGVTTNPSLILKSGRRVKDVLLDIANVVNDNISGEVISQDVEGMIQEAHELMKISPKIVIKVPMTADGLHAVRILKEQHIRTNVTLVFSPAQALLAAKAGATFISPFLGRLDDIDEDSLSCLRDIHTILQNYHFDTQIICASIRSIHHIVECAKIGADIATVPYPILMSMFSHPLT
ncbi:MAG: fructose-6-phosphate aldolase, partial [Bacilli bacterium]